MSNFYTNIEIGKAPGENNNFSFNFSTLNVMLADAERIRKRRAV